MTTKAVAQRGTTTALSIQDGQTEFNQQQVATLAQLGVANASRGDLAVFFHQAVRTGLDPFARQIYMIERQGKQTIQTGIDGFRLVARRAVDASGESLGYEDTLWCGKDGQWRDVWLEDEPPAAARVVVLRNGQRFQGQATFKEYAGRKRNGELMQMWATKGALMLAKCAEALALRKAFPQDLSGLYTADEMHQADNGQSAPSRPAPAPRPTLADAVQAAKPDTPAADRITREQWGQITAALTENGYEGQAQQQAVADLLGREVTNPQDITAEEANRLLTELSTIPDGETVTEAEVVETDDAA